MISTQFRYCFITGVSLASSSRCRFPVKWQLHSLVFIFDGVVVSWSIRRMCHFYASVKSCISHVIDYLNCLWCLWSNKTQYSSIDAFITSGLEAGSVTAGLFPLGITSSIRVAHVLYLKWLNVASLILSLYEENSFERGWIIKILNVREVTKLKEMVGNEKVIN